MITMEESQRIVNRCGDAFATAAFANATIVYMLSTVFGYVCHLLVRHRQFLNSYFYVTALHISWSTRAWVWEIYVLLLQPWQRDSLLCVWFSYFYRRPIFKKFLQLCARDASPKLRFIATSKSIPADFLTHHNNKHHLRYCTMDPDSSKNAPRQENKVTNNTGLQTRGQEKATCILPHIQFHSYTYIPTSWNPSLQICIYTVHNE